MIRKALFLFLILGLILRAYNMREVHFFDWDEGIYAETTSELFDRHSLQTYFNGQVYLDKPPISNYSIALGWMLVKDPELGARLAMTFYGSLMLIFTYLLTQKTYLVFFEDRLKKMKEWEKELVFFIPVLVTASTPLFLERSTQLNTDVMLGVAWLAYYYFFDTYWAKLIALCFGVWTKSLLGFYPLAFEVLRVRKISFSWRGMAMLLIPSLWYIFYYMKFGSYFLTTHIMDQIVKRAAVPIELHMGNKWYYIELMVKNFHIFLLFMGVSYLWILYDAYVHKKEFKKRFDYYLILFSALPFFIFLNLAKSKITWYIAIIVPLFALVLPYAYLKIRIAPVRYVLIGLTAIYFLYRFIPGTYALDVKNTQPADSVKVALCLEKRSEKVISVLEPEQERKNRNYLEASHQQTETSFMYGGMPSFIYYAHKPIRFFWKPEEFVSKKHDIAVVSKDDNQTLQEVKLITDSMKYVPECSFGTWLVYSR